MADNKIAIGNVEIIALTDTVMELPLAMAFPQVTADAWAPYRQRYSDSFGGTERWRTRSACYLLRSQGRTVLVDTGIGPGPIEFLGGIRGRLLAALEAERVRAEDIDTVFFTHLHLDHVGWNLTDRAGRPYPVFPKARYLIPQADWNAAQRPETQEAFGHVSLTVAPLQELGVMELFSGEKAITGELTAIPTPGHTPGHASLLVVSNGQRALVWGDVTLHPAQVTEVAWNAVFDMAADEATQTRRQILERIEAEGMTVAACHFPEPGFGRLVRLEGRRYWQAA